MKRAGMILEPLSRIARAAAAALLLGAAPAREADPHAAAKSGQGAADKGPLPVSEGGQFRIVGRLDDITNGQAHDIAAKGRFVYMAMCESREVVLVYDFADPAKPRKTGYIPAAGWVKAVKVMGNDGATFGARGGPSALDFTDPAKPFVLKGNGGIPMLMLPADRFPSALLQNSTAVGNLLFTPGTDSVNIWDIADPAAPKRLATVPDDGPPGVAGNTRFLAAGDRLYLQAGREIVVYDLAKPAAPAEAGRFEMPALGGKIGIFFPAAATPDRLYVLTGQGGTVLAANAPDAPPKQVLGGVAILDVSIPSAIRLLGTAFVEGIQSRLTGAALVEGKTLAVSDLDFGLRVFDVADPAKPRMIAAERRGGEVSSVTVSGDFVYLGQNLGGGLWVIDATDKTKPRKRGMIPTGAEIWGDLAALRNEYVYFCESSHAVLGLGVADVRDPDHPKLVARIPGAFSYGLAIHGDRLYVGDGKIFDISKPAEPRLLPDRLPMTLGRVYDGRTLLVADNRLHLSLQDRDAPFFAVFDLANPDRPALLGQCDLWTRMHRINRLCAHKDAVFLAGGTNLEGPASKAGLSSPIPPDQDPFSKVTVLDVRDPAKPAIKAKWTMDQLWFPRGWDDRLNSVNVMGDRLYVTQYSGWTQSYDIRTLADKPPQLLDKIKAGYWTWRTLRQDRWLYCARLEGLDIIEIVPGI